MKIHFLPRANALDTLIGLTRTCDSMEWAVAWATPNQLVEEIFQHRSKLHRLVVGTHLYQTHPEVLQRFSSEPNVRVMPPVGDLFHPKLYLFRKGDIVQAVIGSHNLTQSAMNRNIEASVLIEGLRHDDTLKELSQFIQTAWSSARPLTSDFIQRYSEQYKAKAQARESLTAFVDSYSVSSKTGTGRAPYEMGWDTFVLQVTALRTPGAHDFLAVLDGALQVFGRRGTFIAMTETERKLIAGTAGRTKSLVGGVDYQLFGSMGGSGCFAEVVQLVPGALSEALDAIPISGSVTQSNYNRFRELFLAAFAQARAKRIGGLPTASRLLAMKRPDVFVCINTANRNDLCAHFGVPPTTTNLDNYWERIIAPMMETEWWRSPTPTLPFEETIWKGRAALLDVIYYDRSAHRAD